MELVETHLSNRDGKTGEEMTAAQIIAEPGRPPTHESILLFRDRYAQALESATIAESLTAEIGWQRLYQSHRDTIRDRRRQQAKMLKAWASALEDRTLDEEDEKAIGEIKKAIKQIRDDDTAFDAMTVGPVREPVQTCEAIRRDAINEARRDESEAPMLHIGLVEKMRDEISRVQIPVLNIETGRVEIAAPER